MLSQNKKLIMITSVVIASTTFLGGAASAQQNVASAQQNTVSTQQKTNSANETVIITDDNGFNNQQFKFPPQNAVPQYRSQSARPGQNYPMPYPSQRQAPPRSAPYSGARGQYPQAPVNTMRPGPGVPPYAMNPYNRSPFQGNQGPYGNPYNRGPYQAPYGNPYNRGPYGGSNNGLFDRFGMGPFNGNSAPWETWPFGARDSFWSRKDLPFNEQNPTDWFQPGDPKEGMAIMWDDLISAPDDLGTMPGGWHVPSVSVPNPVDLEDQLEKASKEVPDLIRVYND